MRFGWAQIAMIGQDNARRNDENLKQAAADEKSDDSNKFLNELINDRMQSFPSPDKWASYE
jgi:hypothetical protein